MTTEPIGVGVVGGGFAARAHIDALRRVAGVRIAGIAASTPERSRAVAGELGLPAVDDYRAMLDDDSIAAIHDCTPNDLHLEVNRVAIEAGRHVLSEKPLATDSRETAWLVELARTADVITGVCFNYRHYPLVQELRSRLAAGGDGSVHLVTGTYLQDWLLLPTDWNWRLDPARGGTSRAVADIGSHWIDLVQHITGDRIAEVCADLGRMHDVRRRPVGEVQTFTTGDGERADVPVGTEDWAAVLFRTERGARGSLTVSQVSAGRKNHLTLEIDAESAAFAWDQEEPNTLWIGRRDEPNAELVRDPSLLSPPAAALAHYPGGHQEGWPDALFNLVTDFYAAVRARRVGEAHEHTFASFADAHRTTQTVEAIVASSADRAWVRVGAGQEAHR
ncbi:MAG: Gfo/Idh/MocA family protein [Actinomycetota bacterium]